MIAELILRFHCCHYNQTIMANVNRQRATKTLCRCRFDNILIEYAKLSFTKSTKQSFNILKPFAFHLNNQRYAVG